MIFGSVESLECYCAHLLLSEDEIYFTVLESKGSRSIYGPRPAEQVLYTWFVIMDCLGPVTDCICLPWVENVFFYDSLFVDVF